MRLYACVPEEPCSAPGPRCPIDPRSVARDHSPWPPRVPTVCGFTRCPILGTLASEFGGISSFLSLSVGLGSLGRRWCCARRRRPRQATCRPPGGSGFCSRSCDAPGVMPDDIDWWSSPVAPEEPWRPWSRCRTVEAWYRLRPWSRCPGWRKVSSRFKSYASQLRTLSEACTRPFVRLSSLRDLGAGRPDYAEFFPRRRHSFRRLPGSGWTATALGGL